MTKHTNKNTNVKGFYLDATQNFDKIAFEVETAYTRSVDKAREYAAEKLEVAAQFVVVTEIENEAAKPFEWRVPDIMADFVPFVTKDEAKESGEESDVIAKYSIFDYAANVFGYRDGKPIAECVIVSDYAYKATKGNARSIVREYALENCGFDSVVFVDNALITEYERFSAIPCDVVENYKVYKNA